jgi:hypothetical protein
MVLAIIALFVSLGGTGYAASQLGSSPTAVAGKTGKKKKSPKTLRGPRGATGPTGPAGVEGKEGKEGKPSKEGTQGKEGPPGPYVDTLPSGKSEKGQWSIITVPAKKSSISTAISFPIPLSSPATAHFIEAGATPPAGCSGTVAAPVAAPGNLCVFNTFGLIGFEFQQFFEAETYKVASSVTGKAGVVLILTATVEGSLAQAAGSWAVTE